jgi:predicted small integral membrane protein
MKTERYFKTLLVFFMAAFCLSVGIDNIVDYQINYEFVKHVVSMDTMKPWFDASISLKRGTSNPAIHAILFHIIIAGELIAGFLSLYSFWRMIKSTKDDAQFMNAKTPFLVSSAGMLTTWYFGFNIIAANWFYMWANVYDAQVPAYNFSIISLLTVIYVMKKE